MLNGLLCRLYDFALRIEMALACCPWKIWTHTTFGPHFTSDRKHLGLKGRQWMTLLFAVDDRSGTQVECGCSRPTL